MSKRKLWLMAVIVGILSFAFHLSPLTIGIAVVLVIWGINFFHGMWEGILDEIETQRVIGRE